jgi:hypothetical protein
MLGLNIQAKSESGVKHSQANSKNGWSSAFTQLNEFNTKVKSQHTDTYNINKVGKNSKDKARRDLEIRVGIGGKEDF